MCLWVSCYLICGSQFPHLQYEDSFPQVSYLPQRVVFVQITDRYKVYNYKILQASLWLSW